MPIFISDGPQLRKLAERPVGNEKWLQGYIANHPEILDVGEETCILAREFQTNSGPVDVLAIGRSGILYVVEVKLERNTTRREVIAQAIDYGSAIWRRTNDFDREIRKSCHDTFGMKPEDKVSKCFGIDKEKSKEILKKAAKNAKRGNIVFVIAMDSLTPRIEDAILFINSTSKLDVLGIEVKYYVVDDTEIVASRVFGTETLKRYSENRQKWNEEDFFSHVEGKWEQAIRRIYKISKELSEEISWGSGSENASFGPIFKGCKRSLFNLYSNGRLQINLGWIGDIWLKERYTQLLIQHGIIKEKQTNKFHINIKPEEWVQKIDEFVDIIKQISALH